MPQLDQFTYFTQFIWLFVCFMSFYVLLYNNGLPKVSRILKLRNFLVNQTTIGGAVTPSSVAATLQQNGVQSPGNTNTSEASVDIVIKDSLNSCISFLNSSVKSASEWCAQMVTHLNTNPRDTSIAPLNHGYIKSVGEISLAQMIKHITLNRCTPFSSTHVRTSLPGLFGPLLTKGSLNRIYLLRMQHKIFFLIRQGKSAEPQSQKDKGDGPSPVFTPVKKKKRSQNA